MKNWRTVRRGQGLVEYALIAGLIAVVCLAVTSAMGDVTKSRIQNVPDRLAEATKGLPAGPGGPNGTPTGPR